MSSKAKTNPTRAEGQADAVQVRALRPISHDNVVYQAEEVLPEMTASQAQSLVDVGAAELV